MKETAIRHVYVAVGDGAVKIGTSRNLERRTRSLRNHDGRRFEIAKLWPHPDGYKIEMLTLHSLARLGFERLGREVFVVSPLTAKREVTAAIRFFDDLKAHCCGYEHTPKELGALWVRERFPGAYKKMSGWW